MPKIHHPGYITFVDANKGTEEVKPADAVPEGIRFAPTPEGPVPVVKVVAQTQGNRRTIRQYAEDGFELRSTVQTRPSKG